MKIIDLKPNIDNNYKLDAIYEGIQSNNNTGISCFLPNGVYVLFYIDYNNDIYAKVSFNNKKTWVDQSIWDATKFLDYLNKLKSMTVEEVQKRE